MTSTTSPPLTQTPPPMPRIAAYFERPGPAAIILGSFFAVTLPMAAVTLFTNDSVVTWLYIWLFGVTHFVITLTIYANSANLKYFASSWKTATIFFAVPVTIFVAFDLIHAFRMSTVWPLTAALVFGAVRFFDFFHLNRQTFGVLQMFKGRTKLKYPPHLRKRENGYTLAFVAWLMTAFLAGGVCPLLQAGGALSLADFAPLVDLPTRFDLTFLQIAWLIAGLICSALFASVIRGYLRLRDDNPHGRNQGSVIAYATFQFLGTLPATLYFPLYLAALAMHYVEYHILMAPRCFHSPVNPESPVDRHFMKLRSRPIIFYILILAISAVVAGGAFVGMNAAMGAPIADFTSPISTLMLIALFDGIFVFHYFVEMYIWKFSDPHFRKMMNGLYFSPKPA